MTQHTQDQAVVDFEKSAAHLSETLFLPVFFEKLAALGIEPETETEAAQLVQLGAMLEQQLHEKTAGIQGNTNPLLAAALEKAAGESGAPVGIDDDSFIRQKAAEIVHYDDNVKAAALNYVGGIARMAEAAAVVEEGE